jgi:quercetin dioxygenase-like cupin family protein
MLGQIERGDVHPTISTLWKIASGLKIPFTELMTRPEADCEVVCRDTVAPLVEDGGKFRNYPMFPFDGTRRFEMYMIELDPGSRLEAEAHPEGTQEFITAFSGRLAISLDGRRFFVDSGCAMRFRADRAHTYENLSGEVCRLSMVIYYPQ